MSEHTKGEWSLNNYHFPFATIVLRTGQNDNDAYPGCRAICDIRREGKTRVEYEANARRICQCVNSHDALLEACKKMQQYNKAAEDGRIDPDGGPDYWGSVMSYVDAAIAEAEEEGEQK